MSRSKTLRPKAEAAARLAVLLAAMTALGGCFLPYSKQALPMRLYTEEQALAMGLRLGERAEITRTGLRIFTWPLDLPSAVEAVDEMIIAYQGVGIANLEVSFHEWSILYIWSYPKVTVAGTLVLPGLPPGVKDETTTQPAPDGEDEPGAR